jgi:uncharacterized membrane protein YbhN (UPF0104 family)
MLNRLVTNPWTRAGMLAVFLACCGYGLYAAWPQATAALARLDWYSAALSLAAAMAGAWFMMLAWRAVLADLGSPLPLGTAARVSFVGQLGKYVPGAVWALAAHVELGHDAGVSRRRGVAAVAVSLAVAVGAGLGVAALTLPLTSPQATRHLWWVLVAVPVIALGLCPPVLGRLINRALTLTARPPLERGPSWGGLARALGWTVLGWLALGLQVWLLLAGMTGRGASVLPIAIGGYALAYAAGLLLVVFPNGIGAREIILIAVLAPVVPHGAALAVALAARLLTTASDLAWGLFGLMASGRLSGRPWAPAAPEPKGDASAAAFTRIIH